ncbi:hypothetical protein ACIVBQ_001510 [Tenacibaculum discolor]
MKKNKVWAEKTKHGNSSMYKIFVKWITEKKLADQLTKRHIIIFLNHISDTSSNTTRNNFKRLISSLLSQLVADDILSYNFVKDIPSLKAKPEKNQPFIIQQLEAIKDYLVKNDKYLYKYMKFVIYALMRPVEICRLKVKDIDLQNNTILFAETTNILIIEPLKEVFQKMNLENYNADDFLFTKKETSGKWDVKKESSKNEFFSRRFKKLKDDIGKEINLNDNHSIYSARHTAAKILFILLRNRD